MSDPQQGTLPVQQAVTLRSILPRSRDSVRRVPHIPNSTVLPPYAQISLQPKQDSLGSWEPKSLRARCGDGMAGHSDQAPDLSNGCDVAGRAGRDYSGASCPGGNPGSATFYLLTLVALIT